MIELQVLRPLVDYLANHPPQTPELWQEWQVMPIGGGRNNLLYRATTDRHDLAIKFTIRDERDRAGREYNALLILQQAGLDLAPTPILLDRDRYPQPVMVQSWLEGTVNAALPVTDAEWMQMIEHLVAVHSITPHPNRAKILPAVLTAHTAEQGRELIRQQTIRIPAAERPAELQALLQRFEQTHFPDWTVPPIVLCRVDNQLLNFVRRPDRCLSIDWENSGWGDPAFELADWSMHVAYRQVSKARWQWVFDRYNQLVDDKTLALRVGAYRQILAVWWAVRLYRYLYEMPKGLDQRLVAQPEGWQADIREKYDFYIDYDKLI